jgi:aldose 1-epimerase
MASRIEQIQNTNAGTGRLQHGFPIAGSSRGESAAMDAAKDSALRTRRFGVVPGGGTVDAWTLTGRGGVVLEVMTYGGIVMRLLVPGRDGKLDDVVLGFGDLDSYLAGHPYFGAITGRVAGRIAGAAFSLGGKKYELACNEPPNHLHGGVCGFDKRIWNATPVNRADGAPSLRLEYLSPDGEEGYPGNLKVAVTYTVTNENVLLVESEAASDRTTPLSLTYHSYFNLAGEGSGTIADHRLEIPAGEFIPVDENLTLTGRVESVARHANDFRHPRRLGDMIPQLYKNHGDLYILPERPESELTLAGRVEDPRSGRVLTVLTTERYVQLYTGRYLDCERAGKSGVVYGPYAGVCMECEGYADASNVSLRKGTLLHPGQTQRRATAYAFSVNTA